MCAYLSYTISISQNFRAVAFYEYWCAVEREKQSTLERQQQSTTSTAHWRRTPLPAVPSIAGSFASRKVMGFEDKPWSGRPSPSTTPSFSAPSKEDPEVNTRNLATRLGYA
ncbi:unnamed protein product [Haemonchus placei]|uniref:Uncharacterized protein n=1 Tax=Haemonchus placei TaxID=6290 RepID=A0A0N4WZS9_HAEPC|nr:unnamed protein product [Haemonchus placei]